MAWKTRLFLLCFFLLVIPYLSPVANCQTIPQSVSHEGVLEIVVNSHEPPAGDLRNLVSSSDLIVLGRVERVTSRLSSNQRMILTDFEFRISQIVQKRANIREGQSELVRFTLLGGSLALPAGNAEYRNAAFPLLVTGQDYILFLRKQGDKPTHFEKHEITDSEKFVVVYGAQGAFQVLQSHIVPLAPHGRRIRRDYGGKKLADFLSELSRLEMPQ